MRIQHINDRMISIQLVLSSVDNYEQYIPTVIHFCGLFDVMFTD